MSSAFQVRSPSILSQTSVTPPPTSDQLPTTAQLAGQWFMVSSSSPFWASSKHSITTTYIPSTQTQATSGVLEDLSSYLNDNSSTQSVTKGISSPSASEKGVFHWRGASWLRFVTTKWEIVGYGALDGAGKIVLVTVAQKTTFTPQSVSIYSRQSTGLSPEDIKMVTDDLKSLGNVLLNQEIDKMHILRVGQVA